MIPCRLLFYIVQNTLNEGFFVFFCGFLVKIHFFVKKMINLIGTKTYEPKQLLLTTSRRPARQTSRQLGKHGFRSKTNLYLLQTN